MLSLDRKMDPKDSPDQNGKQMRSGRSGQKEPQEGAASQRMSNMPDTSQGTSG